MTGEQVRAARIAAGWTQQQLADRAAVGLRSIRRIEVGEVPTPVIAKAVKSALREAGIVLFTDVRELEGLDLAIGIAVLKGASMVTQKAD